MIHPAASDPLLHILVIDDNDDHRFLIVDALGQFDVDGQRPTIHAIADPAGAVEIMQDGSEWIVLCDQSLGTSRGTDWLPRLTARDAGPVIVMTSHGDDRLVREAYERGAAGYLLKDELLRSDRRRARGIIQDARRHWRLDRRTRELTGSLEAANLALRRRNRHLRRITASTERFMEDVAHDLRGPLASISCYAEMLAGGRTGPVNPEQQRHLEVIRSTAVDLHGMVNDFLDASRIRADTIAIDRRALDVRKKIEAVVDSLAPVADRHEVHIAIDADPALPPAYGDRERIRRVLQNLLGNAIEHGRSDSEVTISARRDGDGIRIAVIDRGPGIPPDVAERIFERFQRGSSDGRATDGLGLGLAIALEFARASLGRLELEDTEGGGATFTFVVPVAEDGAVRRAAERRWRSDDAAEGVWIQVGGVDDASEASVRSWLATQLGATGIVLPTRQGDRLRAGRPGSDLGEWIASVQDAQQSLPEGDPSRSVTVRPLGCLPCARPVNPAGDVTIDVHHGAVLRPPRLREAFGPHPLVR